MSQASAFMQTLLLPCEKGTLSLTRRLPRVFSLCHPHILEFGKLIPPSSWTSLDIPFLHMRLRMGWQLVKGHTALQNGIRIRLSQFKVHALMWFIILPPAMGLGKGPRKVADS